MPFKMMTALLAGTLALAAIPAQSAPCAQRAVVLERLQNGFGETVQSMGLGPNNRIVEVFASVETGTWTITVTSADGITCLVASGQSFENLEAQTPAKGEPA